MVISMKTDCLLALERFFSTAIPDHGYTLFSCHEIPELLPGEEQLSEQWAKFELLTRADWAEVHASIDAIRSGCLLVYGMRMAFLSVRANKEAGIWHGLMGIVLGNDIFDYRAVLSVATLLYEGALRLEANPEGLFQRAVAHASPKRRELLEGFETGPNFTKSIESKGFVCFGSGKQFTYKMARV
jgi:hypothetical protein